MDVPPHVETLLSELSPQVLGVLARGGARFDLAEDAVQEALVVAAERWTRNGVPERPFGWLLQTARRRFLDEVRSEDSRRAREALSARREVDAETPSADDSLALLFLCCHPAITPASAIALTLRAIGGLSTAAIAQAFLVSESTMGQRISRAKRQIAESGVPFTPPSRDAHASRLRSVLHTLYLMFNEGYATSGGPDLQRVELSSEAIRLARLLTRVVPDDAEVEGLLALMLLIHARRGARVDTHGRLVPLPEQDRRLWDAAMVAEGLTLLEVAAGRGAIGEYWLQAAIAAVHDRASAASDTDWPRILFLYGLLEQLTANPVVTVNRAVAAAMVDGPLAGLAILDGVEGPVAGSHRVDAVRAHLLEMAGETAAARSCYLAAAASATSVPERRHLEGRAARLLLDDPIR